jgi:hypothetical protein
MKIDVAGRVRNVNLPTSRPLLPLLEAIVNSIQAIDDAKEKDGSITIKLIRDSSPNLFEAEKGTRDITAFEIVDNGTGFTEANFEAFLTSDTTSKAERGGKGIGRFVWLVAFDRVEIESNFNDGIAWKKRRLTFIATGDGITSTKPSPSSEDRRTTIVRLLGFKEKYRIAAPKKLETIGAHLVEHCLEFLIHPNPPRLTLVDDATNEKVDLNDIFEKEMALNSKYVSFKLGKLDLKILHVRLYSTHIKEHLLHYCANNRVVKSDRLAGRIPDLAKRLLDEQRREFVYASYLDSDLLDATVNQERTDFSLSSEEGVFSNKTQTGHNSAKLQ